MRSWGAVDTPADPASLSHLTSICELAARLGLSSVGEPGAGLPGSGAVAITLPELERALQFGARLVKAACCGQHVRECFVCGRMHAGEVGLVGVAECLACQRAGGVVVALIGRDPGPEGPAVGEVDNVFGGAGLLAFESQVCGFIGLAALVERFGEVDQRRRAEACLP